MTVTQFHQFCQLQELLVLSITGSQFRRLQELSFIDHKNPVSFRRLQELSLVNQETSFVSQKH